MIDSATCAAQPTGYDQNGTCVRMLTMAERKQRRRAFLARQKEEAAAAAAAAVEGIGEGSVHSATSATSAHSAPEFSEVPRSEVVAAQHVKESIEILRRRAAMTRRDIAEIAHHSRAHNEANYALFWVSAGTRSSASAPRPKRRLGRPAEMTVGPRARIFAEAPSSPTRESHRHRQMLRGVTVSR